jgi:hypothetical protein
MASEQHRDQHDAYSEEQMRLETGESVEQAKERDRSSAGDPAAYVDDKSDPNEDFYEEFAAETAPAPRGAIPAKDEVRDADSDDVTMADKPYVGWFALALAIASLFVWPAVLGPAGAVLGLAAWVQGSRGLGIGAIILGVISFLSYLVLVPLYS